jgi:hypothetical protein
LTDKDIESIRKILHHRGKPYLSELLKHSISDVVVSSTYGNYLYSLLSTFDIYSPIEQNDKLKALDKEDRGAILDAVLEIYPPKERSPEITNIHFYVGKDLEIESETIKCKGLKEIGFLYVQEQILKCEKKINDKDYDGAITNSRTLIESVCLFILDESKIEYKYDGNLIKLYRKVYETIDMDPALYNENCFKKILSGIISIVDGLSNLRNVMSDAHGRTIKKYYKPDERHALLAVNISKVISDFIYTSWEKKLK